MRGDFWHITQRDKHQRIKNLADHLTDMDVGEFGVMVQIKRGQRTTKQRNAMEVYCRQVAEDLAARGFDMQHVCSLPITPTQANVKENIWKPVMKAITGKTSTTELDRAEVSDVYMHVSKALAEKFGVTVPFPDRMSR